METVIYNNNNCYAHDDGENFHLVINGEEVYCGEFFGEGTPYLTEVSEEVRNVIIEYYDNL